MNKVEFIVSVVKEAAFQEQGNQINRGEILQAWKDAAEWIYANYEVKPKTK